MKCRKFRELITAAADGELEEESKPQFEQHLSVCKQCRAEYDLERATKAFVMRRIGRAVTPAPVRNRIIAMLQHEGTAPVRPRFSLGEFLRRPIGAGTMVLATTVAAVAIFVMFSPTRERHSHAQPFDGDIIHQTYNNFDRVLNGQITPQLVSADRMTLDNWFDSSVDFHVTIPRMKDYRLRGGVCSKYKHAKIAHLVYSNGNDIVYLYQTKLREVLDGDVLQLPPNVLADVRSTGWHFENHLPDCSLAVWVVDSTICCAIADIRHEQLVANLRESE